MFARLAALATFALPLVSALTLNTPVNATTGGVVTVTWSATTSDPATFSLELVNTVFHNTFAIANSIQTSTQSLTLELPQVPVGDGYTIEAIQFNDINVVYATSGGFSIGAQVASSSMTSASMTTGTGTTSATTSMAAVSTTATTPVSASSSSAAPSPSSINSGAASFELNMGPVAAILSTLAAMIVIL